MVYISVGVGGLVVLLITAGLTAITITVCLRQRTKKEVVTADNVAYGVNQKEMELSVNVAYSAVTSGERREEECYDYVTSTEVNDVIITATPNEAYGVKSDTSVSTDLVYENI